MEFTTRRLVAPLLVVAAAVVPAGAAAAATAPGAAQTTLKGVVVARERARGTLVVASAGGAVETLRTSAAAVLGSRVAASVTRLPDGTYRAATVLRRGSARRVRVHGVVVATSGPRVLVSAGGSVIALDRGRTTAAAGAGSDVRPGDVVDATVSIDSQTGSLDESSLAQVGEASLVSLEGTVSSLSAGTLVLAVEEGAPTTIAVPATVTLPSTLAAGDRVELLAQLANGAFTLVSIQDDHAAAQSGSGVSSSSGEHQSEVEAEGLVTAVSPSSLTVQPEEGSPVVFVVPSGIDVSSVVVGDHVHAKGALQADGTVALVRLELQGGGERPQQVGGVEAEGTVTALAAGSLTVQPKDGGAAVAFVVPTGFDLAGVAVGSVVAAKGTATGSTVTLTRLEVHGVENGSGSDHQPSGSGQQSSGSDRPPSGSGSGGDG